MISVIIPTFNRVKFTENAIKSVVDSAGTSTTFEIVVVDDGSCESDAKWLASYCAGIESCRYVKLLTNQGVHVARNRGITESKGEYIKFLDSDDMLMVDSLANESVFLTENSPDVLVSGWIRANVNDVSYELSPKFKPSDYPGDPLDAILAGFGAPISSIVYRKDFIGDVRWDSRVRHPDDWFFLIQVLLSGPRLLTRSEPVFVWRDHDGERQSDVSAIENARGRFFILDFVFREMLDRGALNSSRKCALANYFYKDIYVAHRYDHALYKKIVSRLQQLTPQFSPTVPTGLRVGGFSLETVVGFRTYIPIHNFLRRLLSVRGSKRN